MFGGVLSNLMANSADDVARVVGSQAAKKVASTVGDDVASAAQRYAGKGDDYMSLVADQRTGKTLGEAISDLRKYNWEENDINKFRDRILEMNGVKPSTTKQYAEGTITNMNPTGGVLVDYTPEARMSAPLADNIKTLADTAKMQPDDLVDIYRGLPDDVEAAINPGDFITTNPDLAKSYGGNVHKMQVRYGDILDDINEPLGEEYIYRPAQEQRLPVNVERRLNAQGKEWIQSSLGDNQGYVGGFELPSAIRISTSNIRDEALRGKGYGREMYQKLIDEAAKSGKILQSDVTVEPAAQRVYDSLKKRGYDVRLHPASKKLDDGSLFVDLNEPVYTVIPGKNSTK